jgi:hypothetical protein
MISIPSGWWYVQDAPAGYSRLDFQFATFNLQLSTFNAQSEERF